MDRCLQPLFQGIDAADLEGAVICNGYHDEAASVVGATGLADSGSTTPTTLRGLLRWCRTFSGSVDAATTALPNDRTDF